MSDILNQKFQQIDRIIEGAEKILIASHENPDADAVASVLTFHYFFKKNNLASLPYLADVPPKNLSFLPGFFEIKKEIGDFVPDVLLCLDYGDFKRLRLPESVLKRQPLHIITIDHHLESDQRGEVKILDTKFSSTAEIIYRWLKYKNVEIGREIATALLTGIFDDSGGFCHVSTSSETLNIVSELISKGVSLNQIATQTLLFHKPLGFYRAWGQVLSQTKIDKKTGLAYAYLDIDSFERLGMKLVDFDGLANLVSTSSPLNLGLFLIEYEKGKVKGSLRSEPKAKKNAADIAQALGGGGHHYAAGFQQEGTIDEVLQKVLKLIE
jgi:phosphoesterase RecJ-like protein